MDTKTLTLADFLLARFAEDEAAAQAAGEVVGRSWFNNADGFGGGIVEAADRKPGDVGIVVYDEGRPNGAEAIHIARHDPARVLTECEAKRRIVELAREAAEAVEDTVLRALALPYADHPDYRDEWRP